MPAQVLFSDVFSEKDPHLNAVERLREYTDQKNSKYGQFLRSEGLFNQYQIFSN